MKRMFGHDSALPSTKASTTNESIVEKAERLCKDLKSGRVTEQHSRSRRKSRQRSTSLPQTKEWTKNIVLIDYQGKDSSESKPLYDYMRIFDGLIRVCSDMPEDEVRNEIVHLVRKKKIVAHNFHQLSPEGFDFVRVSNRRVRPIDGDLPSDAQGLAHIYHNGSIYIRLNSDALWVGCIPCISPVVL